MELLSYEEARQRAEKGYAFLEERGQNIRKISLEKLDLNSNLNCIFGQLFGGFIKAVVFLKINVNDCINMGFSSSSGQSYMLKQAWKDLIQERTGT